MREYVFVAVGKVGSTTSNIKQELILCEHNDKRLKLSLVVPIIASSGPNSRTIIFCQKKQCASWVRQQLARIQGCRSADIHGDRTQQQREQALRMFRDGHINVLVATDVAARGLDVPDVTHVIQFDLPVSKDEFSSYVHRIGRTGRAGKTGLATALFVPGMKAKDGQNGGVYEELKKFMEEAEQEVPEVSASV